MGENDAVKLKIIRILQDNPQGLHLIGISRLVGAHRHTVTKYVHELMGAGVIEQKEIGTVKICYLSNFKKK